MTENPANHAIPPRHTTVEQQFRAVGAIVGSAVGDALGAPFEFGVAGEYSRRFPVPVLSGNGEMIGGGGFNWAAGEFTDDTQMALALAESLLAVRGFDAEDLWTRFRAWAYDAKDIGINTSSVLSHPSHQGAAEKGHVATGGRSASNGCVMRIAPVGVIGVGLGQQETIEIAAKQAALTHFDPAAAAGAAIVAEVIRRVIITGVFHGVAEKVVADLSVLPDLGDAAAKYAPLVSIDFDPRTHTGPGNGSVWTTVAQALWAVRPLGDGLLPLFAAAEEAPARATPAEFVEPAVRLPVAGLGEEVINDYRTVRLSLKEHPMALLRPRLHDTVPSSALATLANDAWVTAAGVVTCRQRPGTASGVIFMTLEDETGFANIIVWPKIFERFRKAVLGGRVVAVTGRLQKEGIVIHVVANRVVDLSHRLGELKDPLPPLAPGFTLVPAPQEGGFRSRDFH